MTAVRLLLVGRRQGALAAAARLGAEVFLLDESPRKDKSGASGSGYARVRFDDRACCVAAARRILGGRAPDAVVALVERAVIPAAAVREALGVRGAGVARARLWRDKVEMKGRVREAGIACADHRALHPSIDPAELASELGLPMVVKPRDSSGGRGTTIVGEACELRAKLAEGWMAERFVHGVELSVESIVQDGAVLFENTTEYLRPRWANVIPASLPERIARAVQRTNRAAIDALDVRDGITHLEVFVIDDGEGEPSVVFGELACRPPGGSLMELLERAYHFDAWRTHIELELGRPICAPGAATCSAGVWFLHPGEGRVQRVSGLEEARAVPGVTRVECKLRVGQIVGRRNGVGQHTGRIVAETPSRDGTALALEAAHALVRLELARDPLAAGATLPTA